MIAGSTFAIGPPRNDAIEHQLHCPNGNTQQSANANGWNLASLCGVVRCISAQIEIPAARFWHAQGHWEVITGHGWPSFRIEPIMVPSYLGTIIGVKNPLWFHPMPCYSLSL